MMSTRISSGRAQGKGVRSSGLSSAGESMAGTCGAAASALAGAVVFPAGTSAALGAGAAAPFAEIMK